MNVLFYSIEEKYLLEIAGDAAEGAVTNEYI
jgi:hypothetical protein